MICLEQTWYVKTPLEQHKRKADDLLQMTFAKPFCSSCSDPQACFAVDGLVLGSVPLSPSRNHLNTQEVLPFQLLL